MKQRFLIISSVVTLSYFFAAKLGLALALEKTVVSAVWPPAGIAIASMLLFGYRIWPAIAVGAFLANFHAGASVFVSTGIAIGNTLEAVSCSALVHRFTDFRNPLAKANDIFYFLCSAMLGTVVGATIGTGAVALGNLTFGAAPLYLWLTWWLGDTVGIIVVAPLLLAWGQSPPPRLKNFNFVKISLLLFFLIFISLLIFGGWLENDIPISYLALLPLLFIAFSFDERLTSLGAFLISAIAIYATLKGHGPFVRNNTHESLLFLQLFLGVSTITSLVISAVVNERKMASNERDRERLKLETVVRQMPAGMFIAEAPSGKLILGNRQAEQIWRHGFLQADNIEAYAGYKGFHSDGTPYKPEEWPLARTITNGETVTDEEINFIRGDQTTGTMRVSSAPVRDRSGSIVAGVCVFNDVTSQKQAEVTIKEQLREKEALLQEVHHRVKNNLQIVASLLNLQASHPVKDPLNVLRESQSRIQSMALIHEKLYTSANLGKINFGAYIEDLVNMLFSSHGVNRKKATLEIDCEDISMEIHKAVPCGLILNEIVSNSLKHALPKIEHVLLKINFSRPEDTYILEVSDNGPGIPKEMDPFRPTSSLGLKLISILVAQLNGKMEIVSSAGTKFKIEFK